MLNEFVAFLYPLFLKPIPDVSRIGEITGSTEAKKQYNATGNDIVIAIVDTGVDFSNPDIQHSLARDELNHPIMLDPDGQGIVLTNASAVVVPLSGVKSLIDT